MLVDIDSPSTGEDSHFISNCNWRTRDVVWKSWTLVSSLLTDRIHGSWHNRWPQCFYLLCLCQGVAVRANHPYRFFVNSMYTIYGTPFTSCRFSCIVFMDWDTFNPIWGVHFTVDLSLEIIFNRSFSILLCPSSLQGLSLFSETLLWLPSFIRLLNFRQVVPMSVRVGNLRPSLFPELTLPTVLLDAQ